MARKRISEFRAKTLLSQALNIHYSGIRIHADNQLPALTDTNPDKVYAVKVDQGVKGRFKKGLVLLNQPASQIPEAIEQLSIKGYTDFIAEPMSPHDPLQERYLALERTRDGITCAYSQHGGIDIETQKHTVQTWILEKNVFTETATRTGISEAYIERLYTAFNDYYLSFLEINPFIIQNNSINILDAAVEVDSTAEFFVNDAWSEEDFTDSGNKQRTVEERNVQQLAAKSQAAFSLEVLNPNGSIFMMLSGGGASIVLADEVYNQGYGKQLANYGEYSGNPNAEETYLYATQVLSLLLKSSAEKKVLIIAGGVANFTDVRVTFTGLIHAMEKLAKELQHQGVKIYVRRGGPYQEEGLQRMQEFLQKEHLLGIVSGPDMVLTDIVTHAIKAL